MAIKSRKKKKKKPITAPSPLFMDLCGDLKLLRSIFEQSVYMDKQQRAKKAQGKKASRDGSGAERFMGDTRYARPQLARQIIRRWIKKLKSPALQERIAEDWSLIPYHDDFVVSWFVRVRKMDEDVTIAHLKFFEMNVPPLVEPKPILKPL